MRASRNSVDHQYSMTKSVTVNIDTDYTTPARGLLCVGGYSDVVIEVKIDGIRALCFKASLIAGNSNTQYALPVPKGAVIHLYVLSGDTVRFNLRKFYY